MPVIRWKTCYSIQSFLLSYWLHLQASCVVSCSVFIGLLMCKCNVFQEKKLILGSQVEFGSNKCKCRAKEEGQDPPQLGTRERMNWRSNSWCLCSWVIVLAWGVVLWSNLGFHTGFVRSHEVFLLCFNRFFFLKKCGYAVALDNLLHFFSELRLAILF